MSKKTYYLKYRPKTLEELDLVEVRESLQKIVKSNNIPHAFLFAGPKGSGKTSAARILARVVNCQKKRKKSIEPCNKCDQCASIIKGGNIDVIELDAASHRGIDDVRALRDAVKLAPAKSIKKVYIIDEAHMLTTEASNALLKTLEEPPDHVMFILATTNPEKLIATIRSRTTNIIFGKATNEEIIRSLKRKTKGEKIKTNIKVLKIIADASEGSFRDADKILEQLVTEKIRLKEDKVRNYLFKSQIIKAEQFFRLLLDKNTKSALGEIEKVTAGGVTMRRFLEVILGRLRSALHEKSGLEGEELAGFSEKDLLILIKLFLRASSELQGAFIEQIPVEIAVVEWCSRDEGNSNKIQKSKVNKNANQLPKIKEKIKATKKKAGVVVDDEIWARILSEVKPINTSTEALLRAAKPLNYDGETLELGVFYSFHKERLESVQHRNLLENVLANILGGHVRVLCTLIEAPQRKVVSQEKPQDKKNVEVGKAKSPSLLTEADDEDIIKVAREIFGS